MRGQVILATVLGILLSTNADSKNDEYVSVVCRGEQSTGFNWEGDGWKNVRFHANTYLITKIHADKALECLTTERTPPIVSAREE